MQPIDHFKKIPERFTTLFTAEIAVITTLLSLYLLFLFPSISAELQPYDEAYYALRARAVAEHPDEINRWINQIPFSIKGFYSGSHPPLMIMAMAGSILLIQSEEMYRVPSILGVILTSLVLWQLQRKRSSETEIIVPIERRLNAQITVSFILFTPIVFWYGRAAMFESAILLSTALQLYFYRKYDLTTHSGYLIMTGLAITFGLLSKALITLLTALPISLHLLFRERVNINTSATGRETALIQQVFKLSLIWGVPVISQVVWLWGMNVQHPGFSEEWVSHFILGRVGENQTGTESQSGWLYYLNWIAIRFPLGCVSLFWGYRFIKISSWRTSYRWLLVLTTVFPLIVLSLSKTKLPWYGLYFFIPLAIISAEQWTYVIGGRLTKKELYAHFLLLFPILIWSMVQPRQLWRDGEVITHLMSVIGTWSAMLSGLIILLIIWRIWAMRQIIPPHASKERMAAMGMLILLIGHIPSILNTTQHGLALIKPYKGAKNIAEWIETDPEIHPDLLHIHLVAQQPTVTGGVNPQVSFYLSCWECPNGGKYATDLYDTLLNQVGLSGKDLKAELKASGNRLTHLVIVEQGSTNNSATVDAFEEKLHHALTLPDSSDRNREITKKLKTGSYTAYIIESHPK